MKCCDLEVYTHDGFVIISQERKGKDPEYVQISTDQIDLLCDWLTEAADSLKEQVDHSIGAI